MYLPLFAQAFCKATYMTRKTKVEGLTSMQARLGHHRTDLRMTLGILQVRIIFCEWRYDVIVVKKSTQFYQSSSQSLTCSNSCKENVDDYSNILNTSVTACYQ